MEDEQERVPTKEEIAELTGYEISDDEYQKQVGKYFPEATDGDKPDEGEKPKDALSSGSDYQLPEHVKDKFIPVDEVDKRYYPRELIDGDPIADTTHPLHEAIVKAASEGREWRTKFNDVQGENEQLKKLLYRPDGTVLKNDPTNGIYGGISREDVEFGNNTMFEYMDAKDAFRELQLKQKQLDYEAEFSKKTAAQEWLSHKAEVRKQLEIDDATVNEMEENFGDGLSKQGKRSGFTYVDVYAAHQIEKHGGGAEGLKKWQDALIEKGRQEGRSQVTNVIAKNVGKTPAITNSDGVQKVKDDFKDFRLVPIADYLKMSANEKVAYEQRWKDAYRNGMTKDVPPYVD